MKSIKGLLIAFSILLMALNISAQTEVNAPMTGTPAAGSYFSYTDITLNPDFLFTSTNDSSLDLYIIDPDCKKLVNSFNQNQNYIVTSMPRISGLRTVGATPNSGDFAGLKACDLIQEVQYLDGLGRSLQIVKVQGSPSNRDVVQAISYDQFGRKATKYLNYSDPGTANGGYKADALTNGAGVLKFYNPTGNGTSGAQQGNGIVVTPQPFAQTIYEPSPLNRTLEQGAEGTDWQPVAGNSTGHTQKIVYTTNNDTTFADTAHTRLVALYRTTINTNLTQALVLGNGQGNFYKPGQLYVTVHKDENWKSGRGGTAEEYKDKEGRLVLKRIFNYTQGSLKILSTYYVYDDLGNLAFVLPPSSGADNGITSQANQLTLDNLCYQYRYDGRDRLVEKKVPGKAVEYTVYNMLDQVVGTQDGLQRAKATQEWSFTKYDQIGRIIATGIYQYPGSTPNSSTRADLQNTINNQTVLWETRQSAGTGYTGTSWPQANIVRYLVVNFYDDYTFPNNPYISTTTGTLAKPTGLLTATKTAAFLPDGTYSSMLWTVHFYDEWGRLAQTDKQHYLGGEGALNTLNYDEIDNTYNFNEQVINSTLHHIKSGTQVLRVSTDFDYDHAGRKTNTWEQITNGTQTPDPNTRILLSKIEYNEIGQTWKKHLHSTDQGNSFKQDITYSYNERGWLQASSAPLFAEQLYYNTGTNKSYNGNIAYQYWGTPGSLNNNYAYTYDQLNRLTSAIATTGNNESGITYDLIGNVSTLKRDKAGVTADLLNYSYVAGTNKLQSVTDGTNDDYGQIHGVTNYTFDINGNLLTDDKKGITGISYNMLNLPMTITGKNTTYTYDATGQKLKRSVGTATTDYIDGIQYDGTTTTAPTISFIQTEEGRAIPNGSQGYNYEYAITDHLNNNRVSFDTGTGLARKVQADDYYPFGMDINSQTNGTKNEYLYTGKELQENLGFYDYGARFYDPVLVRWNSIDPLAENSRMFSPYIYGENNPIRNVDPDGASTEDWLKANGVKQSDLVTIYQAPEEPIIQDDADGDPDKGNGKGQKQGNGYFRTFINQPIDPATEITQTWNRWIDNPLNILRTLNDTYANAIQIFTTDFWVNGFKADVAYFKASPEVKAQIDAQRFNNLVVGFGTTAPFAELQVFKINPTYIQEAGPTFAEYKALRGGNGTLDKLKTANGFQRISVEYDHVFITQRVQRGYNVPNWAVNNRLNVWKLNTIQHALIDRYRFQFLKADFKPRIGFFYGEYNWFTKFPQKK